MLLVLLLLTWMSFVLLLGDVLFSAWAGHCFRELELEEVGELEAVPCPDSELTSGLPSL